MLFRSSTYENAVTYGCLAAMIVLIAYGSRTIIMARNIVKKLQDPKTSGKLIIEIK